MACSRASARRWPRGPRSRSEEHTSELQSRVDLVCRLLLENKKFEEIARFARVAAGLGIDKRRVRGGEPLVRKDLPRLIEKLIAIPGIRFFVLTTNGVLLAALSLPVAVPV